MAKLPFEYRLLYAGLWCFADKEGRLQDRPRRLKADIFPYDDNMDIEKGLKELAKPKENSKRPFIQRYEIEGERFIQILKWFNHQKPHHTEKDSEIPPYTPLESKGNGEGNGNGKPAQSELDVKEPLNNRYLTDKRHPDLQSIMDYAKEKGFGLQGSQEKNRQYAYNLLRKKDGNNEPLGKDRVLQLIDIALATAGEPYSPTIGDFKQLYYKFQDLLIFIKRKKKGDRIG